MTPHGRLVTRENTLRILETLVDLQNKVTAIHRVLKAVPSDMLKDSDTYVPEYVIEFEFYVPPYDAFLLKGQGEDLSVALQDLINKIDMVLFEQQEGLTKQKTKFGQQLEQAMKEAATQ